MPLRVNVKDMSDMEIADHIKKLQEEQEDRKRVAKELAWNEVCKALKLYTKENGFIEISFENELDCATITLLSGDFDTTTHGVIKIL